MADGFIVRWLQVIVEMEYVVARVDVVTVVMVVEVVGCWS